MTLKGLWQNPVTLILIFLLVISIRFNRNIFLIDRGLYDAAYYISNVEYFRSDRISAELAAPFNERLLVCFAAAGLPFDPMTSINLVNVLFLLAAVYFLYKTMLIFEISDDLLWSGLYIFVFSFPTFYYATIGYVDSGVLLMIFFGNYGIWKNNPWIFLIAVVLGTLAKEGIIIIVPVAVAYGYSSRKLRWYLFGIAGLLLYLLIWGAVKHYMPKTHGNTPVLYWMPNNWRIIANLSRFSFYFSSLFSYGIPGILLVYLFIKNKSEVLKDMRTDLPLLAGFAGGFGLWIYGIFSAYADGRFFWISACFPILLSLRWIKRYGFDEFCKPTEQPL